MTTPKRGDTVRLRGGTETAIVKGVGPGTVEIGVGLDRPLNGYMTWNSAELEIVPNTTEQYVTEFVTAWRRMDRNFSPEDCVRLHTALLAAFTEIKSESRRAGMLEAAELLRAAWVESPADISPDALYNAAHGTIQSAAQSIGGKNED